MNPTNGLKGKDYMISSVEGKSLGGNLIWLHDKCPIETIKAICNKPTAKSNTKWGKKPPNNLIKIMKETRLFTLSTLLQYSP